MRIRLVLVIGMLAASVLPAATGSAADECSDSPRAKPLAFASNPAPLDTARLPTQNIGEPPLVGFEQGYTQQLVASRIAPPMSTSAP